MSSILSDDAPTPPCASCGEEAEPWPFACPECERVHHARCWRARGGCAACGCRTHSPKPDALSAPAPRATKSRVAYLRFVAAAQRRLGRRIGPAGLAAALVSFAVGLLLLLRGLF